MKYRPEIDGLRALAVLPVILFHAGFEWFSGGFVGVDVFFVISGYLITTIIISEMSEGKFSIVNFYERRARRILPALFFVMAACLPFALILMNPIEFREFAQSIFAVNIFASNFFFSIKSGYFDPAVEEKPLLHTWSLAVEEQFYMFFPIFLILIWPLGKNRVFYAILILAAFSLLLSELGWRHKPNFSFYFTLTRAWELLAGSFTAFLILRNGIVKNNSLSFLGLLLIVFSIFIYDKTTPFPSIYTLVPVAGVLLLILHSNEETIVGKLLSMKVIVLVGLISYSAYLWHQPIFAFARIELEDKIFENSRSYLFGAIFLFSYLSWRFIEMPFRNKARFSKNDIFKISIIGIFIFSTSSLAIHFMSYTSIGKLQMKHGFIYNVDIEAIKKKALNYTAELSVENSSDFVTTKQKILILGDSIADDFLAAIKISEKLIGKYEVRHLNYDDLCFDPNYKSNECNTWRKNINEKKNLLLESDLILFVVGFHPSTNINSLLEIFGDYKKKIRLIGSAHFDDPYAIFNTTELKKADAAKILSENKHLYTVASNIRARGIAESNGLKFVNLYDFVCDDNYGCEAIDSSGNILIFDTAHRTPAGINFLSNRLEINENKIFK